MGFYRIMVPVLLCCAAGGSAFAAGPAMDFDRGFDVKAALEAAGRGLPPIAPASGQFNNNLRSTRDCRSFAFKAGGPAVSDTAELTSYVFQKACSGGQCYDQLVRTVKRKVRISLSGDSALLPWEQEAFGVCLEDTALEARVEEASHKYEITKKPGMELTEFSAEAVSRLRTEPDHAGITAVSWGPSGSSGSLELALKDKWAAVYGAEPGEKTVVKITVREEAPLWPDGVVFEQELVLAPAELYNIDLSLYAAGLRRPLEAGRKYYAQWGFRREGGLSRGVFVKGGETARAVLPPR